MELTIHSNHVCSFLRQSEVSRLSLAAKPVYELVRPILYRHPKITSFTSLTLFQRTIIQATYMGKVDFQWSTRECLDQTRTLELTIDPTIDSARNNGEPPAAIMVSRMIQAIVRRCPNIAITLRFAHCQCEFTPISRLESETFPRVTKLMVYVGRHEPDGSHTHDPNDPRRRNRIRCCPNPAFWRPFVNGICFPDCKSLEIRHFWATTPPDRASLDLKKNHRGDYGGDDIGFYDPHGIQSGDGPTIGATDGLKRFESILLESPPELNSSLLMQLLGNPKSVASNLARLELRFCNLNEETISNLLYHAPPNLKHLVLLHSNQSYHSYSRQARPHLCPLIREFAKNMVHLEFAAPTICRELFFDDLERLSLRQSGIATGIGATGGVIEGTNKLDTHLIRDTVQACRKQKKTKYRNGRVKEAITMAKAKTNSASTSSSLFGGSPNQNNIATRAHRDTEFLLDEEEEQRSRLIEGSKTPWFRRIVTWQGLCSNDDTWAEIQLAADMEEKGVEWVVVSE